jgi:hypothetical protein
MTTNKLESLAEEMKKFPENEEDYTQQPGYVHEDEEIIRGVNSRIRFIRRKQ